MKILLTIFVSVALTNSTIAQNLFQLPVSNETGLITYQDVIWDSVKTQKELYSTAMEWFAKTYNSSTDVIQYSDEETGKIIGKGVLKAFIQNYQFSFSYTITIEVKDGRIRYTVDNFYRLAEPGLAGESVDTYIGKYADNGKGTQKRLDEFEIDLDSKVTALISSLKEYLKKKNVVKDDW